MRIDLSQAFYNASGVTDRNDPERPESLFAVDRLWSALKETVTPGQCALDLCCGAGRFTFALESLGAIPTGIDCAEVPLQHAWQVAAKRGSRCRFVLGNVLELPFCNGCFDLVFLPGNVVEFTPVDLRVMVDEIGRVLAPGGVFCLSMKREEGEAKEVVSRYTVPGHGEFEYHSYSWTTERVRLDIGERLDFVSEVPLGQGRHWLVFRRGD